MEPNSGDRVGFRRLVAKLDGWHFFVVIARLLLSPFVGVLVDALLFLLVSFEVLANPAPELAAGSAAATAEEHLVNATAGVDLNLTEGTALPLALGGCHRSRYTVAES